MGKQALFCVAVYVLCSLLTADAIPVDPKFDPKKFAGKWYPLLTGSQRQPPPDKVFALTVKPLSKGGFSADIEMPVNGTCQVLKFNFKPTEPGYFKSEDEKAIVSIVESNNNHGVITVLKMDDVYIMQLFVRNPKVSSKWRKRFNDYAEKYRFNAAKVQDISHAALCEPPPKKKLKM